MKNRIIGDNVEINYSETLKFFEDRGAKMNLKYLYNLTMYQDSNPDIVIERDIYEKSKVGPLLKLNKNDKVLDIGCGVGRWGEEVLNHGAQYVGIDFSSNLISLAQNNLSKFDNEEYDLINCSFQEIMTYIKKSKIELPYNKIICTGFFMYLNDNDIIDGLINLVELIYEDCLIYIKESISMNDRLTLNKFFSKELKAEYGAIYRSKAEYDVLWEKTLIKHNFKVDFEDYLYSSELNNRKETSQYLYILHR